MEEINNIEIGPCTDSDYLKPFRVHYNQVSSFASPERGMEDAGCWRLVLAQPPFIFAVLAAGWHNMKAALTLKETVTATFFFLSRRHVHCVLIRGVCTLLVCFGRGPEADMG